MELIMCSSFAIGQTPRLFLKRNRLTINGTHMAQRDGNSITEFEILWRKLFKGGYYLRKYGTYITVAVWTQKPFTPLLTRPQGSQGCQKIRFFLQIKVLSSCAKIAQKRHKLWKLSKLKKKTVRKNHVFLDIFEYSSIWGRTKSQMACLVDLLTPLAPLGARQ